MMERKGSGGVAPVSEANELHLVKFPDYTLPPGAALIFKVSTTRLIGNVLEEGLGCFWLVFDCVSTEPLTQASKSSARKVEATPDCAISVHCCGLS